MLREYDDSLVEAVVVAQEEHQFAIAQLGCFAVAMVAYEDQDRLLWLGIGCAHLYMACQVNPADPSAII